MQPAGQSPVLDALDRGTLTSPVRRALGSGTTEIVDWRAEQIAFAHFNPTSEGLYRIHGTARDQGGPLQSWSLVLKVAHTPAEEGALADAGHLTSDWNYWKREFLAYRSGLLDELPAGVVAPRCYGASEQEDGSVWLWLEEVADSYGPRWQLPQYAVAARQLGQLNGAFLAGRPLPTYPWLSSDLLRGWVESFGAAIDGLDGAMAHPLVQRGYPGTIPDRLRRLWAERNILFAGLDRLPLTLAHQDAHRQNLFMRRAPDGRDGRDGRDQAVAIDWAFMGCTPVGAELAPFVTWSAIVTDEVANLTIIDATAFTGYLSGLALAGWNGEERLVRFGYTAAAALHQGALLGNYWQVCEMEDPDAFAQTQFHCSVKGLMDRIAGALAYLLDLADEARWLLPSIMR